jgi:hypothetical protein
LSWSRKCYSKAIERSLRRDTWALSSSDHMCNPKFGLGTFVWLCALILLPTLPPAHIHTLLQGTTGIWSHGTLGPQSPWGCEPDWRFENEGWRRNLEPEDVSSSPRYSAYYQIAYPLGTSASSSVKWG